MSLTSSSNLWSRLPGLNLPRRLRSATLAMLAVAAGGALWASESVHERPNLWEGGLDPRPTVESVVRTGDVVTVRWTGISPTNQLVRSASATAPEWTPVGNPTRATQQSVAITGETGFFRVASPEPHYVGFNTNETLNCGLCHASKATTWKETRHAGALATLQGIGQGGNTRCLQCHTVGMPFTTGYQTNGTTAHLGGVQCENCHGPAGNHFANFEDGSVRPAVTLDAAVCGGCHNGFHHPFFDEWFESRHSIMDAHVAESIEADATGARSLACGPCHSGATRISLLNQLEDPSVPLASPHESAKYPVVCATCHDPHADTAYGAHLRNPVYSTDFFSYNTSASTSFAAQYREDIQLCAQCHNQRGATWDSSSRPPHHSPQYNMLIGETYAPTSKTPPTPVAPILATHGRGILHQCAHCHTHGHEAESPSEEDPNYTGHTFAPMIGDNCAECHGTAEVAASITESTQFFVRSRIQEVKGLLDEWATTKAPQVLREKYGVLAWEFTTPGQLSTGSPGPSSSEQSQIPNAIKQARYNLYIVEHDGSYGAHNGTYARKLLTVADDLVRAELAK